MINSFLSLTLAEDFPFVVPTGVKLSDLSDMPLGDSPNKWRSSIRNNYNFKEEETPQPISYSLSGVYERIEITLKILNFMNEKPLACTINRNDSIYALKQKLDDQLKIPPENQHLIYHLKDLEDEKNLEDYEIWDGDTLNLIIKVKAGGCFPGESKLHMADGTQRRIDQVHEGEFVMTFDVKNQTKGIAKISGVMIGENKELCLIKTDKNILKCTPNHAFWDPIAQEWKAVRPFNQKVIEKLVVGDKLLSDSQLIEIIRSIEIIHLKTPSLVYDLSVDSYHTFFINDILAHNKQIYFQLEESKNIKIVSSGTMKNLKDKLNDCMSNRNLLKNSVIFVDGEEMPEDSEMEIKNYNEKVVKFQPIKVDKGVNFEGKLHVTTNKDSLFETKKTKAIDVNPNDSILIMKQQIAKEEGVPVEEQEMIYAGRILADEYRLSDYNIHNEAIIRVCLKSKAMEIYVKTFQGRRIQLEVFPEDNIGKIKKLIEDKEKLKKEKVSLFYLSHNNELLNEKTLGDYNIPNHAFLYLELNQIESIIIYFQPQKRDIFPLKIELGQTIHEIKRLIEKQNLGIHTEAQCFIYHGQELEDKNKISHYPIFENSVIYLVQREKNFDLESSVLANFQISIKMPWGKVIKMQRNQYDLIGFIKLIICRMENLYYSLNFLHRNKQF